MEAETHTLSSYDIIIVIVITGDEFNAVVPHDGLHFPEESEWRADEAITSRTSNIRAPPGLFLSSRGGGYRGSSSVIL